MTERKERPMLFSGPLVREIRAGRKSVTRRPVKPQPTLGHWRYPDRTDTWRWEKGGACFGFMVENGGHMAALAGHCPYGKPGDRLWVRETWAPVDDRPYGGDRWVDYRATPRYDAAHPAGWHEDSGDPSALKWRPSIHMPRWASRLLLEVTAVRVEQLRSITCDEIRREGLSCPVHDRGASFCHGSCTALREHFYGGWDALYAHKPELHAERDPWLWVVDFQLLEDTTT